jgi:hypothetical protein
MVSSSRSWSAVAAENACAASARTCSGYAFAETELADDVREPQRALNGFYLLSRERGGAYTEELYDERYVTIGAIAILVGAR